MPSRDQQFGWLVLVSLLAHMIMLFLLAPHMSTPSRRYLVAPPPQIVRLVSFGARATEPPAALPKQAAVAAKPKPEKPRPSTPAPVKAVALPPVKAAEFPPKLPPKPEPAKPKQEVSAPPIQTPPMPQASDKILPQASDKILPKAAEKPVAVPPAIPQNPKPVIPPAGSGRASEISEADRLSRIQQLEKRRKLRESALAEKQIEQNHPASPAAPMVSEEEMAVYQGVITHRVRQRWVFTGGGENLSAEVLIALDRNGSVRTQKITRGSGNVEFDRSVLRAIAKASPFPPPPEGADTEIQFRFRSEED